MYVSYSLGGTYKNTYSERREKMSVLKENTVDILNAEIKKKGVKKKLIAERVGMTPTYISFVLNKRYKLSTDLALKICSILDLDVKKILR